MNPIPHLSIIKKTVLVNNNKPLLQVLLCTLALFLYIGADAQKQTFLPKGEMVKTHSQKGHLNVNDNFNTSLFSENFDGELFPPENWQTDTLNTTYTWMRLKQPILPFSTIESSSASAICPWDDMQEAQDEVLISPPISLTESIVHFVSFYAGFSKNWIGSATLALYVTKNEGVSWNKIWEAANDTISQTDWMWRPQIVDGLSAYANETVYLAWRYTGSNGDLMAIDGVEVFSSEGRLNAELLTLNSPYQKTEAVFDTISTRIDLEVLAGTKLDSLVLNFSVSEGASSFLANGDPITTGDTIELIKDEPFEIRVYPENPSAPYISWLLYVDAAEYATETDILSFSFGEHQVGDVLIDKISKTVEIEVLYETNIERMMPEFELSPGASIGAPDLSDSIAFTINSPTVFSIQAQNKILEPTNWYIYLSLQDYLTAFTSFSFTEVIATAKIDKTNKLIRITVPNGTDISVLEPEYTLSAGAICDLSLGEPTQFNDAIEYPIVVTAADTVTIDYWTLIVFIEEKSKFKENFDVQDAYIENGWTTTANNENTWQQGIQVRSPFSVIKKESSFSALCPWSETAQNEWLLSPEISTEGMISATLKFYAGYSRTWLQNATLKCYVRDTGSVDFVQIWDAETDTSAAENWAWREVRVNLDSCVENSIQIAWQYIGIDGDLVGIDNIQLIDYGVIKRTTNENVNASL